MQRSRWRASALIVVAVAAAGAYLLLRNDDSSGPPNAQDVTPTAATSPGPCPYASIDPAQYGEQPFENPPEISSEGKRLDTTLTVELTDPATTKLAGCGLTLRSYNGELVGPTLRVKPGDTLNLSLHNDLPIESPAQVSKEYRQEANSAFIVHTPASYNTTNVHYHGLHVSPRGHGDNVLLNIKPQTDFQYHVALPGGGPGEPPAHPPGTFWYHAHAHGSTAIQVGSGMAGALIVEDDPTKIPPALAAANEHEKVMLFESILYDTRGQVENIKAFFPSSPPGACAAGKPTCTWQDSMRRTTINGQIVPQIQMQPGEVQRWRMIDGTFRESLHLQLEGHDLHEIALDGLYLGRIDTWDRHQNIDLEPGYRSDVLVKASARPGTYNLYDIETKPANSLLGVAEDKTLLAQVVVQGDPLHMTLPTDKEMAPLAPFGDLDLSQSKNIGIQDATFSLTSPLKGSPNKNYFQVNHAAFSPDHVRTVFLNDVDQWRVGTEGDPPEIQGGIPALPHVFHIHVNPFQMARTDPDGNDEAVWKDTLLVQGDPVNLYTTYTDFTGEFVMHCHILDHEDLGMMEAVNVIKRSSLAPGSGHER